VFPIRDVQGRPSHGRRILPTAAADPAKAETLAKYINSPEPAVFQKQHVYALDYGPRSYRPHSQCGGDGKVHRTPLSPDSLASIHRGRVGYGTGRAPHSLLKRLPIRSRWSGMADEAGQRRANEILGLFVPKDNCLRM